MEAVVLMWSILQDIFLNIKLFFHAQFIHFMNVFSTVQGLHFPTPPPFFATLKTEVNYFGLRKGAFRPLSVYHIIGTGPHTQSAPLSTLDNIH